MSVSTVFNFELSICFIIAIMSKADFWLNIRIFIFEDILFVETQKKTAKCGLLKSCDYED